jgi:hypothetical protein
MRYKLIIILSFVCFHLYPQHDNSPIGARSAGMGNSSVCLQDLWAVHNNQAGLSELKNIEAGVYYENRFLLKELSFKSLAIAIPSKTGVFGLDINSFGFNLYNENKFGLAYSEKLLKNLSIGIQLDYLHTHIAENYGNKGIVTFETGLRAQISNKIILAAHVFNPIRAKLSDYNVERIPSILKFGLLYKPAEKINICAESEKDINYENILRIGVEYNIIKTIFIRTGISTNPVMNSFGFGFEYHKFRLNFSSSIHQTLGYSPQFSVSYHFD